MLRLFKKKKNDDTSAPQATEEISIPTSQPDKPDPVKPRRTAVPPPAETLRIGMDQLKASAKSDNPSQQPEAAPDPSDLQDTMNNLHAIRDAINQPIPPPATPKQEPAKPSKRAQDVKLYRNLLAALYDAVLIVDEAGHVIGSNQRTEKFFGFTEDELWNMKSETLIPGMDRKVLNQIRQHASNQRFTVVNASCRRKDASSFPAEIAISQAEIMNSNDMILSIRNQERREKARQRHAIQLRIPEDAGSAIVVCSEDGLIEFVNPAFTKLLGAQNEGDVLQHFIGDFCTNPEASGAMVRSPTPQTPWLGNIDISMHQGRTQRVLACASRSGKRAKDEAMIVIVMTPLPLATAAVTPQNNTIKTHTATLRPETTEDDLG